MREKIAWAAKHGLTPPTHAVELAAAESSASLGGCAKCNEKKTVPSQDRGRQTVVRVIAIRPACGAKAGDAEARREATLRCVQEEEGNPTPTLGIVWVSGVFAQKCQGEGPAGALAQTPAVAPEPPLTGIDDPVLVGFVFSSDTCPDQITYAPASPPPISWQPFA
jgi:hypothetical protein